jgi:hypothetical protein
MQAAAQNKRQGQRRFHRVDRRKLLAKVHIAIKDLGIPDHVYRGILEDLFGKSSAGKLSGPQLVRLVNHFEDLGWGAEERGQTRLRPEATARQGSEVGKREERTRDAGSRKPFIEIPDGPLARQKRYILALWDKLGYKQSGLDLRCKKQFGVDRFVWLHDGKALETLAKDLNNRCKKKGIDPTAVAQ